MSLWARVVALPCAVTAACFVFAAWAGFFSGSLESTLPGCFGAVFLFFTLYIPHLVMLAMQSYYRIACKRPSRWSLAVIWSVIGVSLLLAMISGLWSVNYPGLLLPLVYGLSPEQSLQSCIEEEKHSSSFLFRFLKWPLGNRLTIANMFGVFAACLPHLFITSLSLPPFLAIVITIMFMVYCCVCSLLTIRQSFPEIIPFCPQVICMFAVVIFVHVRHLVPNIQHFHQLRSAHSAPRFQFISVLIEFFSNHWNRLGLRIGVAFVSCFIFWMLGGEGLRFYVDAVFVAGFSSIIFKLVITTQGFLILNPRQLPYLAKVPARIGGYSVRRPLLSNALTLLSCIAISLPVQFLPLDWLPFGRHILNFIGRNQATSPGIMFCAFVVWSVLGPMLLLKDLRLSMRTLIFIYGGTLVYVNVSLFCQLKAIASSSPSPPFVLFDVFLESVGVSVCMLLLLTVCHLTMQVSFSRCFCILFLS
jgi:hypothetical protein